MTTLRHEIETNATDVDVDVINNICAGVCFTHPDVMIELNSERMFLRIRARCNGAALRDLIVALDKAGFID